MINDGWDQETDKALDASARKAYDEIEAFYTELHGESARAVAVLVLAQIDEELTKVIDHYFPKDGDKKVWDELFRFGPLGNLANKCRMAQALGAFGQKTRNTILKMEEIRDEFAHRSGVRSFQHPDVLKICIDLRDNPIFRYKLSEKNEESEIRANFITTALSLHKRLEIITKPQIFGRGDPQEPLP